MQASAVATGGNDDQPDAVASPKTWPAKSARSKSYSLLEGEVAVRFINAPGRSPSTGENDIIAAAKPGEVLMAVADSVGVILSRGCMTGLCGTCTCDLEDPSWPDSRAMLRACSAKVCPPSTLDVNVLLSAN